MSVFRAAASDPAHRPSIEAPHPASAVPQRHPLPPGQWVPPQRGAQDPAFTDGPTEPLGAIREAADREIAVREAEAREAAVREFAAREAVREFAVREAESREAAAREAVIRETAAREAALREAALREAALRDALLHDAEVRDADPREDARRGGAREDTGGGEARDTDVRRGGARDEARDTDVRREGARDEARDTDAGLRGDDVAGGDARDAESRRANSRRTGSKKGEMPASREDAAVDPIGHRAANGRPRRRPGVVLAVLLSLLALLISGATGWLSWQTFKATTRTAALPAPQPSAVTVPAAAETRPPRPESYPVAYAKEPLRLQLDCAVLFLDLDEPRADAPEALGDLRYESRCGTRQPRLSLGAGAAAGSRQASSDTDAAGCDRAIRTSPLGRGLQVEVRKGTALCVLTAATPAELVLVEIIDVGGSGTAGLRATSWQVP
jgi:hypothetical protein